MSQLCFFFQIGNPWILELKYLSILIIDLIFTCLLLTPSLPFKNRRWKTIFCAFIFSCLLGHVSDHVMKRHNFQCWVPTSWWIFKTWTPYSESKNTVYEGNVQTKRRLLDHFLWIHCRFDGPVVPTVEICQHLWDPLFLLSKHWNPFLERLFIFVYVLLLPGIVSQCKSYSIYSPSISRLDD